MQELKKWLITSLSCYLEGLDDTYRLDRELLHALTETQSSYPDVMLHKLLVRF